MLLSRVVWSSTLVVLIALGGTVSEAKRGKPALGGAASALAEARTTLDEAIAREKADPGKAATLAVEAALDTYNALAAVRIHEIERQLRRFDRQYARTIPPVRDQVNPSRDTAAPPPMPDGMQRIYAKLRAELADLSKPVVSAEPEAVTESEPNDTPAEATPLDIDIQPASIGSGLISPAGDVDFYSFEAPANSLVWAYVDTGGTQLGTSSDSLLAIVDPDGTTELATDDDDGTGNACDATIESLDASAVAGLFLPAAGTYFARVTAAGGGDTIDPYQLFVCVTPASSVASETEPNDSPATADPIITSGSPVGVVAGTIASPSDVDLFTVPIAAGTPLYVSLDADPERDGGADLAVDLLTPDGATVLLTADSSQSGVDIAEAFCFVFAATDTYLLRVREAGMKRQGGAPSTYRLMAVETELQGRCPPTIVRGRLGSGSVDYPGESGEQLGRLTRNGIRSSCDFQKACPDVFVPDGLRAYDAYTFTNADNAPACVTVTYSTSECPFPGVFASVYRGAFDPNDLCLNYAADPGTSIVGTFSSTFSFTLDAGATAVVVLSDVDPGVAEGCQYTLVVSGLVCRQQTPFDVCMRDDATGAVFRAFVGNRESPFYGSWEYTSGATTLCGRADTINYVPGRSLTMRDYDQANNAGCDPASMQAQFDFARNTALVQLGPLGTQSITLRDRNLADSNCGP